MTNTLSFLAVLLLTIGSVVFSAPTESSPTILEQDLKHTVRDIANSGFVLSPFNNTTSSWVPGEPVDVHVESGNRDIWYRSCVPKESDVFMCVATFIQNNQDNWGRMLIYDHKCRFIGFNSHVSREDLADRFSMSSNLPNYLDINIERGWNPTHSSGVKLWYGAFYSPEPFLLPPQQWLPQVSRDIVDSNSAGRFWWAFRLPFLCA